MNLDSVFTNISPADFGLPSRFTGYRREQRDAFSWLIEDCEHQLSAACLPTGIGKTLLGFSLARYYNSKAVYLVATKSLQEQVMDDFGELAADIRGRANYTCLNYSNCDRGYEEECTTSVTTSCPYNRAVELAKDCSIDVTNYAYWLHARAHNRQALERDTQPVELLICDEAHRIEDQITSFAAIHLSQSDLGVSSGSVPAPSGIMTPKGTHWVEADDWRMWAQGRIDKIRTKQDRLETADPNYKRDKVWKELEQTRVKWAKILTMNENWCWQFDDYNGSVSFEPIRVASYARQLFSGVNRVLLMSASLTPFQCSLILDRDAPFDYRAWSPVFPQQNAPFYHVPCKKVNRHSTDDDYKEIIEKADQIIDSRLDRKGIIHTVSYARTKRALLHSRHRSRFIWNESGRELSDRLSEFRLAAPGSILVTPSVEEGFNFANEDCRYQILIKFPFPNEGHRVIKERCALIPLYRLAYAAQKLVQMKGRPIRSETDWAETFCLDNSVKQLTGPVGKSLLPPGFRIFTVAEVPKPPKLH